MKKKRGEKSIQRMNSTTTETVIKDKRVATMMRDVRVVLRYIGLTISESNLCNQYIFNAFFFFQQFFSCNKFKLFIYFSRVTLLNQALIY